MWVRGEVGLHPKSSSLWVGCGRTRQYGSAVLQEKAGKVGAVAEGEGVERQPGRKEHKQVRKSSGSCFPRSKLNGISPRGKGGKSSPCKNKLSDSCAGLERAHYPWLRSLFES